MHRDATMRTAILSEESEEPPPASAASAAAYPEAALSVPETQTAEWNNWRRQLGNRIRSFDELQQKFPHLGVSLDMASASKTFPMAITPYYASLIERADPSDPIFAQAVPQGRELYNPPCLRDDPLEEDHDMPVPGLVHRYGDRALVLATSMCSVYCRHCTRKRVAGQQERKLSAIDLARIVDYLTMHPEIRDVIVSGGDPFTLPTASLEKVLAALRGVPSVDIIRIGTRTPVVLPMRITRELVTMLRRYHPIYVNTHFNHPRELTPAAITACRRLADAGVPLGNQSVLLRGVNDDPRVLEELFRALLKNRVRPYYLFQCDLVKGVEHFRTPVSRGIEIMEYLRGRLSGMAIPSYIVDLPHGGGKVPVLPNYVISTSPTHTVLRNAEGMLVSYPEPMDDSSTTVTGNTHAGLPRVWDLAAGHASSIVPRTDRHERRRYNEPARHLSSETETLPE